MFDLTTALFEARNKDFQITLTDLCRFGEQPFVLLKETTVFVMLIYEIHEAIILMIWSSQHRDVIVFMLFSTYTNDVTKEYLARSESFVDL